MRSTSVHMNDRRFDLDWLRIIAFGVLILYHVGMFYVSWDWHVKSSRASDAIEPAMLLTSPWRLNLLFLIAGAATRFMADKLSIWGLTASRLRRLCPPLLLAMLVIVPPQSYYEVVEALQQMHGPAEGPRSPWLQNFYLKYLTASGNWCDDDGCLATPTYNHMWFVAYLIVYTLALAALLPLLQRVPRSMGVLLDGIGVILTPWLMMFSLRTTLFPIFRESHDLVTDWYLHLLYFSTFVLGFLIARRDSFFERCAALRWPALAMALLAWAALLMYLDWRNEGVSPPDWMRISFRGVREWQAWTAIVAAIGFAHRHLRHADGPIRRLLTQAIFPFYLIHQTIIVVAAHYLDEVRLPLAVEIPLLVVTTAAGCWLFFELGRRVPALRLWIGLSSEQPTPGKGA